MYRTCIGNMTSSHVGRCIILLFVVFSLIARLIVSYLKHCLRYRRSQRGAEGLLAADWLDWDLTPDCVIKLKSLPTKSLNQALAYWRLSCTARVSQLQLHNRV